MSVTIEHPASLITAAEHEQPTEFPFLQGEVSVFSRRSPTKESANQDAIAIIPVDGRQAVVVLADGCGGLPKGELAAQIAVESVSESVGRSDAEQLTLRGRILDGIDLAHARIRSLGIGSGTTVAIAEFSAGTLRCYHAGDSQILQVGSRGKIKAFTRAHSPTGYAVESGMLSEDDALTHEERYLVSNILGADDYHIEIGPSRKLAPRDTVVIASDGLFDNLSQDEVIAIVRKGPLAAASHQLVNQTLSRMLSEDEGPAKPDDLSIVVVRAGRC